MREIKRRLKIFLVLFFSVALLGTVGFMHLENLSFAEAFYYNIVTMSTVGYGDIHPTSPQSRFFAILLIVLGGSTFLGVIANATEILIIKREAKNRIKKINMVLGIFFSEFGYRLIVLFSDMDRNIALLKKSLQLDMDWEEKDFSTARDALTGHTYALEADPARLGMLYDFLRPKRRFIIDLIENPMLIENEEFSELLLALFHLLDELGSRSIFDTLPPSDLKHLSGDINRAYRHLLIQWLNYLEHLKRQYPYLYSLAARKNPFNTKADAVIREQ